MKKTTLLLTLSLFYLGTEAQTMHTVNAGNFYYTPSELTITAGDTVQWINDGGFHDVNGATSSISGEPYNNPESFDSQATGDPLLYTRVFTVTGTYEYDCSVGSHAANGMVGTIVVNPNTTSVDNSQNQLVNSFLAYYVPNNSDIDIQFKLREAKANITVNIYSMTGQKLKQERFSTNQGYNKYSLRLNSNWPSGMYLIELSIGRQTLIRKVMIP